MSIHNLLLLVFTHFCIQSSIFSKETLQSPPIHVHISSSNISVEDDEIFFQAYLNPSLLIDQPTTLWVSMFDIYGKNYWLERYQSESGSFIGSILIPSDLPEGNFVLKFYLVRKSEPSHTFGVRKIIHFSNEVNYSVIVPEEDKDTGVFADFINMDGSNPSSRFEFYDEDGEPAKCQLSMSLEVNDQDENLPKVYPSEELSIIGDMSLFDSEEIKNGITINGVIKDAKGIPIPAYGYLYRVDDLSKEYFIETDEKGEFAIDGIHIIDTSQIYFEVTDKMKFLDEVKSGNKTKFKKNQSLSVDLLKKDTRVHDFSKEDLEFINQYYQINDVENWPSDSFSLPELEYEAEISSLDDVAYNVDIENVTVQEERIIKDIEEYKQGMLYKRPDQRIVIESTQEAMQYSDIYDILRIKGRGIQLYGGMNDPSGYKNVILLRGMHTGLSPSVKMTNSARILLNGSYVSPSTAESIPPERIAFVDVLKGLSKTSPFGEIGYNGLIIIYLRTDSDYRVATKSKNSNVINMFKIKGSQISQSTPTAEWIPNLYTNDSGVIFFNNKLTPKVNQLIKLSGVCNTQFVSFSINPNEE